MDSRIVNANPEEIIPDVSCLYLRVLHSETDESMAPLPRAFRWRQDPDEPDVDPGMSTDWAVHCSPHDTRRRSLQGEASRYGVMVFGVGFLRNIPQVVKYSPLFHQPEREGDPNNIAHTDVINRMFTSKGDKTAVRNQFIAEYRRRGWVIQPGTPDVSENSATLTETASLSCVANDFSILELPESSDLD